MSITNFFHLVEAKLFLTLFQLVAGKVGRDVILFDLESRVQQQVLLAHLELVLLRRCSRLRRARNVRVDVRRRDERHVVRRRQRRSTQHRRLVVAEVEVGVQLHRDVVAVCLFVTQKL